MAEVTLHRPTDQPWVSCGDPGKDIAVMMSGGVDSSATALLLQRDGWNVLGITMRIPIAQDCDVRRSCCGMEAAYVCQALDIPHYFLEVREAFHELVIEPFRQSYLRGETPSPCIDCNTEMKFRVLWDVIEREFGIQHAATGHYARVVQSGDNWYLARAADHSRDQSYFLYGVPKERLPFLHFPLGDMTKPEARKLTAEAGLPVARREDSMELCFAGEGDYRNALGDAAGQPGPILDTDGNQIGKHKGIQNYTIGQRRGIGIARKEPLYVINIDPVRNSVTVGDYGQAFTRHVAADRLNVLMPDVIRENAELYGKVRSQGEPAACAVKKSAGNCTEVEFQRPQFAPSPGQRLVLYTAEGYVAVGGVIVRMEAV